MKLKEAIEQLKDLKRDRESFLENDKEHDEILKKDIKAIETVLQALEEYQKQMDLDYVDENFVSKEKFEELQKENEELKSQLLKRDATYYQIEACRKEIESIRLIRESFEKTQNSKL